MQNFELKNADEVLKAEGIFNSMTSGASMRPMLREHRDIVTVVKIDRKPKKGDVVLYPGANGKFVLHRIMSVKRDGYIIRGDNNYFTEYGITDNDIIGILKSFYREGKYIDCATDKKYKLYTFYICHSYYLRYLWIKILLPFLAKIKHLIFKK